MMMVAVECIMCPIVLVFSNVNFILYMNNISHNLKPIY